VLELQHGLPSAEILLIILTVAGQPTLEICQFVCRLWGLLAKQAWKKLEVKPLDPRQLCAEFALGTGTCFSGYMTRVFLGTQKAVIGQRWVVNFIYS